MIRKWNEPGTQVLVDHLSAELFGSNTSDSEQSGAIIDHEEYFAALEQNREAEELFGALATFTPPLSAVPLGVPMDMPAMHLPPSHNGPAASQAPAVAPVVTAAPAITTTPAVAPAATQAAGVAPAVAPVITPAVTPVVASTVVPAVTPAASASSSTPVAEPVAAVESLPQPAPAATQRPKAKPRVNKGKGRAIDPPPPDEWEVVPAPQAAGVDRELRRSTRPRA